MLPVLETPLSGEPNRDVIIEAWSEITTELLTKKDLDLLDAHRPTVYTGLRCSLWDGCQTHPDLSKTLILSEASY